MNVNAPLLRVFPLLSVFYLADRDCQAVDEISNDMEDSMDYMLKKLGLE